MKCSIACCRTMTEVTEAYELAMRLFGPNYYEARKQKMHNLALDTIDDPRDVVAVKDRGSIIGMIRIIRRENYFSSLTIKTSGITTVCIHPHYRGAGLGRKLMDVAIDELKKRGEMISILFARRALDGFYNKFGFIGAGQFVDLLLDKNIVNSFKERTSLTIVKGILEKNSALYQKMHHKLYCNIPFAFCRDKKWWKNLSLHLQYKIRPNDFLNVFKKKKLIGYFIINNNKVVEAACDESEMRNMSICLVNYMAKNAECHEIDISLPIQHGCLNYLRHYNHTLRIRRCYDGGHMINIINPIKYKAFVQNIPRDINNKAYSATLTYAPSNFDINPGYTIDQPLYTWSIIDEF